MNKQREIEVKMQIEHKDDVEKIRAYLSSLTTNSWQEIDMKAIYYDTHEGFLQMYKAAYRVRQENKSFVATYKRGISNKNGIAERIEVNKFVDKLTPDITIFKDEKAIWPLLQRLEGQKLEPIVRTDFVRKAVLIDWQGAKIEASLDIGTVTGKHKNAPICELELELKLGDEISLLNLETKINTLFKLEPSTISKYKRGLILAGL